MDRGGNLYNAVELQQYDIFLNIINQDGFDVNQIGKRGRSILLELATFSRSERFAAELIRRGANVNQTDQCGNSFLHIAAQSRKIKNVKAAELILESGADINCQDDSGATPLHTACSSRNINMIYLLISYGADPNIECYMKLLPISVLPPYFQTQNSELLDLLSFYTFDREGACISLSTLVAAMRVDSPLFMKVVEYAPRVICDPQSIYYFCFMFNDIKCSNVIIFIEKFPDVFEILIDRVDLLNPFVIMHHSRNLSELTTLLDYVLESEYAAKILQRAQPEITIICRYITTFAPKISKEELEKRIYLMLSYGVAVTAEDLDAVYRFFDYCDLFRLLLQHIDILPFNEFCLSPIVRLHYYPNLSINACLDGSAKIFDLLDYFNNFRLKEMCLTRTEEVKIIDRVRRMPQVPSMLELSRNVTRRYLMTRYSLVTCKGFYRVLNRLQIPPFIRSILALEIKLY